MDEKPTGKLETCNSEEVIAQVIVKMDLKAVAAPADRQHHAT